MERVPPNVAGNMPLGMKERPVIVACLNNILHNEGRSDDVRNRGSE